MKSLEQILSFEPQIIEIEHGKEPPLKDILYTYYLDHMCTHEESIQYAGEYIHALEAFVGEGYFK